VFQTCGPATFTRAAKSAESEPRWSSAEPRGGSVAPRAGRGLTHRWSTCSKNPQPAALCDCRRHCRHGPRPSPCSIHGSGADRRPEQVKASVTFTTSAGPQPYRGLPGQPQRSGPRSSSACPARRAGSGARGAAAWPSRPAGYSHHFCGHRRRLRKTDARVDYEASGRLRSCACRTFPEVNGARWCARPGAGWFPREWASRTCCRRPILPDELPVAEPAAVTGATELESRVNGWQSRRWTSGRLPSRPRSRRWDAATPSTVAALRQGTAQRCRHSSPRTPLPPSSAKPHHSQR